MTEYCVDASIAIKWAVKGEPFRVKARVFLTDAGVSGTRLIAHQAYSTTDFYQ
jgi:hypothetical protein